MEGLGRKMKPVLLKSCKMFTVYGGNSRIEDGSISHFSTMVAKSLYGKSVQISNYRGGQAITYPWPLLGVKWLFSNGHGLK